MKKIIFALLVTLLGAFLVTSPVWAEDPAPDYSVNPCDGAEISLGSGVRNTEYEDETANNNTTYDGFNVRFTSPFSASSDHGIKLGGNNVPDLVCTGGAIIDGQYDYNSYTWRQHHDDIGGYGLQIFSKHARVSRMTIDNVQDGIKLQNCAEDVSGGDDFCDAQQPGGRATIDHVWIKGHRDDGIDNDDCMPFDISNSMIDGHTGISEQEESSSTGACVSSGEDQTIGITNVIFKLQQTNVFDPGEDDFSGPGRWFKWQGDTLHHTVVIRNSAFAVSEQPRSGWDNLEFPGQNDRPGDSDIIPNTGNVILWLGSGSYPGPARPLMTNGQPIPLLTGQAAKDEFEERRNNWLTSHGCDARPAGDLDVRNDPNCDIPAPK